LDSQGEMKEFTKISIVTPSYNQAQYLEQTINSVVSQNYPSLEYIIMDGGSTDGSVEIINRYAHQLTHWESRKDDGQADAIYRGFERSTGDVLGWINSDDYLLQGALRYVGERFHRSPGLQWLVGGCVAVREFGKPITKFFGYSPTFESLLCAGMQFYQMSCFWRRDTFFRVGGFDRSLQFCFDYDMFLRFSQLAPPAMSHRMLSACRVHTESKSSTIWETTGKKEKELLRQRFGIERYSTEQRQKITDATQQDIHQIHRLYYWYDAIHDPFFFIKSVGASIREFFIK